MKLEHDPTVNQRITSRFGETRLNGRKHDGVDIGALSPGIPGDNIYAVWDGEVIVSKANKDNPKTGVGWYVTIYHVKQKLYTLYAHLNGQGVKAGSMVKGGDKIGEMGYSGEVIPAGAGGTHLHFGICTTYNKADITKSTWLNPEPFFIGMGEGKNQSLKVLKRGSGGEQVKIMQALLGVTADGSFGALTEKTLKEYQKNHVLAADGSCGAATWESLGFMRSIRPNVYIFRIPYSKFNKAYVSLKDMNKTYSVLKHAKENGAAITINAAMFSMTNYQNVTDMVINGKLNNGGNYSDKGIFFPYSGIPCQKTTSSAIGMQGDFIGGAPPLIWDSKAIRDTKGLDSGFTNGQRERMAIGIDDKALYIMTTGKNNFADVWMLQDEGLNLKLKTLINLDGGASTGMVIGGQEVIKAGRNVPSAIIIK